MTPISLITPSVRRDFEACKLLCDTIDRYVTGFERHYVVVSAADMPLFRQLAGPRREIVDEASLLPKSLRTIPGRWRNKTWRWAPGIPPISGWHVQQLIKFGMTLAQPNPRVMFIDSDNCFCRPFDVQSFAGDSVPLQLDRRAITPEETDHVQWMRNAYALLALTPPDLPADDFIGQMIVWDAGIVRALLERIEMVTGLSWWTALCRKRRFSEYMIYGVGVTNDARFMARHHVLETSPALSYWSGPPLDAVSLRAFIASMRPDQCAIGIQSFIGTPVQLIRAAVLGEAKVDA